MKTNQMVMRKWDVLAERVRFFKESKDGISIICKVMEDMRNESLQEGGKMESSRTPYVKGW